MRLNEIHKPKKDDLKVYPVKSKQHLLGLLKKFGWVRLAILSDGMVGWDAGEFTHGDFEAVYGDHINLNVAFEDGKYVVEFNSISTTPAEIRSNPYFNAAFGKLPVQFRDHNTWENVDG